MRRDDEELDAAANERIDEEESETLGLIGEDGCKAQGFGKGMVRVDNLDDWRTGPGDKHLSVFGGMVPKGASGKAEDLNEKTSDALRRIRDVDGNAGNCIVVSVFPLIPVEEICEED